MITFHNNLIQNSNCSIINYKGAKVFPEETDSSSTNIVEFFPCNLFTDIPYRTETMNYIGVLQFTSTHTTFITSKTPLDSSTITLNKFGSEILPKASFSLIEVNKKGGYYNYVLLGSNNNYNYEHPDMGKCILSINNQELAKVSIVDMQGGGYHHTNLVYAPTSKMGSFRFVSYNEIPSVSIPYCWRGSENLYFCTETDGVIMKKRNEQDQLYDSEYQYTIAYEMKTTNKENTISKNFNKDNIIQAEVEAIDFVHPIIKYSIKKNTTDDMRVFGFCVYPNAESVSSINTCMGYTLFLQGTKNKFIVSTDNTIYRYPIYVDFTNNKIIDLSVLLKGKKQSFYIPFGYENDVIVKDDLGNIITPSINKNSSYVNYAVSNFNRYLSTMEQIQ